LYPQSEVLYVLLIKSCEAKFKMNQSKKSLTLFLMISSIALLLVLQVFWLTSSYEKAYFDLRRDTNMLFRSTVIAMRDSLLVRSIERVPSETDTIQGKPLFFSRQMDTLINYEVRKAKTKKSIDAAQVQVYITSTSSSDSAKHLLPPLMRHGGFEGGGRFIIRRGPDSLSIDSLRVHVSKALAKSGQHVTFDIKHSFFNPGPFEVGGRVRGFFRNNPEKEEEHFEASVFSNQLFSDWVRYDPMHRYSIMLSDFRPMLLKEITLQFFFSLFLTAVTIAAFVMLYRSIRSQQRLMELKNDFISNMTHELKTPIATVSVALEALKNFNGMGNPKLTAEYLDIAQHELNRLTLLTDKVLKTSAFEDHGIEYTTESVNLETTIDQILNSMKLVFEKQKATVSFDKEGNNFAVQGGSIHLTNVIYNLLDNALKYSPDQPAIRIFLKEQREKIILSVTDNGLGIPSEFKNKIFEKFFRVPTGNVHTIKGYGLGLSYVDTVIKNHKGTIHVESESGKGSVFTITLLK